MRNGQSARLGAASLPSREGVCAAAGSGVAFEGSGNLSVGVVVTNAPPRSSCETAASSASSGASCACLLSAFLTGIGLSETGCSLLFARRDSIRRVWELHVSAIGSLYRASDTFLPCHAHMETLSRSSPHRSQRNLHSSPPMRRSWWGWSPPPRLTRSRWCCSRGSSTGCGSGVTRTRTRSIGGSSGGSRLSRARPTISAVALATRGWRSLGRADQQRAQRVPVRSRA